MILPEYQSHKRVRAAKILDMHMNTNDHLSYWVLELDGVKKLVDVSSFQISKHNPQIGWYYVVYEDGYVSFSPPDAFEGGYTLIEN